MTPAVLPLRTGLIVGLVFGVAGQISDACLRRGLRDSLSLAAFEAGVLYGRARIGMRS